MTFRSMDELEALLKSAEADLNEVANRYGISLRVVKRNHTYYYYPEVPSDCDPADVKPKPKIISAWAAYAYCACALMTTEIDPRDAMQLLAKEQAATELAGKALELKREEERS